jgi:hypothetical protein
MISAGTIIRPYRLTYAIHLQFTRAENYPTLSPRGDLCLRSGKMISRRYFFKTRDESVEAYDSLLQKLYSGKYIGSIKMLSHGTSVWRRYSNIPVLSLRQAAIESLYCMELKLNPNRGTLKHVVNAHV